MSCHAMSCHVTSQLAVLPTIINMHVPGHEFKFHHKLSGAYGDPWRRRISLLVFLTEGDVALRSLIKVEKLDVKKSVRDSLLEVLIYFDIPTPV